MSKRNRRKSLYFDHKRRAEIYRMIGVNANDAPFKCAVMFKRWTQSKSPTKRMQEYVLAAACFVDFASALSIATNAKGIRDAARIAKAAKRLME